MTNLEKASKAYDRLMNSIDDDKLIKYELERGGLKPDYTIADLVGMIESELDNHTDLIKEMDDELVIEMMESEIKRFKYFIKKWQNVSND